MNDRLTKKRINGVLLLYCIIKICVVGISIGIPYIIRMIAPSYFSYNKIYNAISNTSSLTGILFNIGIYIIGVGVPVMLYFALSEKNRPVKNYILSGKPTLLQTAYAVGTTVFLSQIFSGLYNLVIEVFKMMFGKEIDPIDLLEDIPSISNYWILLLMIAYTALLPAFFEEFSIRGAFLRETRSFGRVPVILLSGLFFMMLHNSERQWGLAFAAGILMAYFTLKFRSIWVAVISHFAINLNSALISYFVSVIDVRNFTLSYLIYYVIYFSLMTGLMIAGLIIYGIKLPEIEIPSKEEKKGKLKLIFSSPFFYIFVFLFILSAIIVWINIF